MGLLIYSFWFAPKCESVADCIHIGLLIYSFGLLPCVRVCCGLYPHGLTDLLFLVCSQVRESVADCIHMGLLLYSWFSPLCESVTDCIHIPEPQPVPSLLLPRETLKEDRDDQSFDDNLDWRVYYREQPGGTKV